jgi:copper chaperone CopZ
MKTYAISGMTCGGCASKVERALQLIATDASVTLNPPRATLPNSVSLVSVNAQLLSLGKYAASEINRSQASAKAAGPLVIWLKTYYPLFLIMGLIAIASLAAASWMMAFMAGFYLVFGAFKLLDVPGFARSYAQYDLVAMAFKPWGYAYPFIEVALGFAFLFWFQMSAATWLALFLSLIGAAGVIRSVLRKETIQCACLGTGFNLPMSTVTIVENLGMAGMAAWMLVFGM